MPLMDDYDSDGEGGYGASVPSTIIPSDPLPVSGYVDARLSVEAEAMFQLTKVEYKPPAPLLHMVVSNSIVVLALTNCHIIRIDLDNPEIVDDIEIPRKGNDQVHKVFLDPTGRHLIVSMESGENLYIHGTSQKTKPLTKMRGHVIESIAFNKGQGTSTSTKEILIGTQRGLIFEAEIEPTETGLFTSKEEKYFKQVYSLSKDLMQPVSGLKIEQFPSGSGGDRKYLVMAVTPTRFYQFIGTAQTETPVFQSIFTNYVVNPGFQELPGDLGYTELHLYSKFGGLPKYFAWMTGPGIYHGSLVFGSQHVGETVATDTGLLPYPITPLGYQPPTSLVLTEFHFLMLYPEKLSAVCYLNEQVVFEDQLVGKVSERFKALCHDPTKNTIWCYSADAIYEITVHDEARDVWRIYLDKKRYDTALQYCKGKPEQADEVLRRQADHYFEKGRYQLAADYYARTMASFEEVALRFLERGEKDAVRMYLTRKLSTLKSEDKAQITMLCMWLVEIYLNRLDQLQDSNDQENFRATQAEFRKFLSEPRVKEHLSVNQAAVYDLINSHGHVDDAIYYARLVDDYERVIGHYIQQKDYAAALAILGTQQSKPSLVYKFSSQLLLNAPKETVSVWMQFRNLDPKQLIPALGRYTATLGPETKGEDNQALRYLEHCVQRQRVTDSSIHNYLISLYVANNMDDQLLDFLDQSTCYDQQYALRLCMQHDKKGACVHIYNLMRLYEEAVDLALQVDVELAKRMASQPYDDPALTKKLWLRIARHVVEKEKDIQKATELLKECDLLKIEEILPFFPDFVKIDHFKDAICTSLHAYNEHIDQLKAQMEEATHSAKLLRRDIHDLRNRYGVVLATDKCTLCGGQLLAQPFFFFPCSHSFHSDCLSEEVQKHMSPSQRLRLEQLQRQLLTETMPDRQKIAPSGSQDDISLVMPAVDQTRAELDDVIGAECVLCGSAMIRAIDQPFISDDERDSVLATWAF